MDIGSKLPGDRYEYQIRVRMRVFNTAVLKLEYGDTVLNLETGMGIQHLMQLLNIISFIHFKKISTYTRS